MARHVKALTYTDKVDTVRSGTCRQTIRGVGKRAVCVGDTITFHGWADRPYRSPWSWRLEVKVIEVIEAELSINGMFIDEVLHAWTSWYPARLAEYDYINPPTGEELRDVLFGLNGAPEQAEQYQIIRW